MLSISRSPSKHTEWDNEILKLRNVDSVVVTSCQKCCIGGQSVWK